jgi:hypothetical protein
MFGETDTYSLAMANVRLQKAGIHKSGPSPCHAVPCLRSAHLSNAGHTFIFRPANISGAMSNVRIHNLGPGPTHVVFDKRSSLAAVRHVVPSSTVSMCLDCLVL